MAQLYTWPPIQATTSNPSVGPNGVAIPTSSNLVGGKSPTSTLVPLSVSSTGVLDIQASSLPLPTGAATEAKQDVGNASLASIDAKLANPMPISATSLPLPTGAATEATLSAVNTKLSDRTQKTQLTNGSIDVGVKTLASGVVGTDVALLAQTVIHGLTTGGGGGYVDVKVNPSGALTVEASVTSSVLPTGAATEATLSAVNGKLNSLGQKAMAASMPVVIASDQSAVPVSLASVPTAPGRSVVATVRNDYSGSPVTSGAWVQLIASTSATINLIDIFDSSGQTLELGLGAAASESRLILVFPGGNGQVPVSIPSGSRLSVRAVSATANAGELDINCLS